MADFNTLLADAQAVESAAAAKVTEIKNNIAANVAKGAAMAKDLEAAVAEHLKAQGIVAAHNVGGIAGVAVAKVEQGASAAYKWLIGGGLATIISAGGGLWYFWPK